MANQEIFDINQLYFQAFGFVAPPFIKVAQSLPEDKRDNPNGTALKRNGKVRGNFNFLAPNGAEYRMPTALKIPGGERYQLPNEPIISIKGGKEIKVTSLNRGNKRGTVKEESNLKDYSISIKGIAINNVEDDFPESDIQKIRRMIEQEGSIEIENYLLRLFNINLAIVQDFDFPRSPNNSFRVQPYTIELMSDEDFELELI